MVACGLFVRGRFTGASDFPDGGCFQLVGDVSLCFCGMLLLFLSAYVARGGRAGSSGALAFALVCCHSRVLYSSTASGPALRRPRLSSLFTLRSRRCQTTMVGVWGLSTACRRHEFAGIISAGSIACGDKARWNFSAQGRWITCPYTCC